ncbi:hypothetical protein [Paenibacillus sp. NPDC055715]
MKVTKTGAKGSQLPKEGFTQKDSAEHKGYAGVHIKILPYIEKKLFLKVNQEKTVVDDVKRVSFLGFAFYQQQGETRIESPPNR